MKHWNRRVVVTVASLLFFAIQLAAFDDALVQQKKCAFYRLVPSGIPEDDADELSFQMQSSLTAKTNWEILDYHATAAMLHERGGNSNCTNLDCASVNGQLLGVDYVCYGSVRTIGKTYAIGIQVADVGTGRTVADVSKFFKGSRENLIKKVIPSIAAQIDIDVNGKQLSEETRREQQLKTSQKSIQQRTGDKSFNDVRGYLAYSPDDAALDTIKTAGKIAFGYLSSNRKILADNALRYSYQLQSYLADDGACAMLYIDEMELLLQARGGNLRCSSKKCAKKVGRLLGVDYMGYGRIARFCGHWFFIRTYIIDVETGRRVDKSVKLYHGKELELLVDVIPQIASELSDVIQ